ncbi:MAG: hypothetical protein MI751_17970 [Pseudomonadales bacterium]|nr:hypothetical protein [Pseudomonadales bacterium]
MRQGRNWLIALLLVLAAPSLFAQIPPLAVYVEGSEGNFRRGFIQALSADAQPLDLVASVDDSDMLIGLGDEAFSRALTHGKPVLGVFVSRALAEKVERKGCHCAAIWAGVALDDQLAMLENMMPLARKVGVVLGENSAWSEGALQDYSGRLSLFPMVVSPRNELGDVLREALPDLDVLLLPVDESLFGPTAAKLILLTSYRLRRPVFGPEQSYVQAGSVASLYASGGDLVSEALVHLESFRKRKRFRRSGFVHTPSVIVNEHVAGSFDMRYSNTDALRDALEMLP